MFRQEAIENRKRQWQGRALLLPGIPAWLIAGACLSVFAALIALIMMGTYARRIQVLGEVTTSPRAINVYSSVQGYVVKRYVSQGQAVTKGSPLYLLDVSKRTPAGIVSENQRREIDKQLATLHTMMGRLEENKRIALASLAQQKTQYTAAYRRSAEIMRQAEQGVTLMKENMENYRRYQQRGLITKDQLTHQTSLYYQQQNNLLNLSGLNEQNALQILLLESRIETQSAEFANQIEQLEMQRHELKKELARNEAGEAIIIRAHGDGTIDSLSVTVGQMVNAGDSLVQILPRSIDDYFLVLWVPNEAIPFISVGDRVNVNYESFPAEKFGYFSGIIDVVTKTPATAQEMLTYPGSPRNTQSMAIPYYKVVVKPDKRTVFYDGENRSLKAGMKAQVTLFLEKRRIYQWMLSPVFTMQRSVMGPVNEP
ncbi:HlyD family secretion protein [Sodalis praecaptivus]|uniref:HlyD family secretion protein n=1 Tax=Sodalis praecaptivus TaxID=1239307 RepID=UPI0027EA9F03|nr:HlyD family secretion protein [Sodalis praecaptivus]CAJ0997076.1 Colicin V secretion protein CvaA [Sodalis praecaptivus]